LDEKKQDPSVDTWLLRAQQKERYEEKKQATQEDDDDEEDIAAYLLRRHREQRNQHDEALQQRSTSRGRVRLKSSRSECSSLTNDEHHPPIVSKAPPVMSSPPQKSNNVKDYLKSPPLSPPIKRSVVVHAVEESSKTANNEDIEVIKPDSPTNNSKIIPTTRGLFGRNKLKLHKRTKTTELGAVASTVANKNKSSISQHRKTQQEMSSLSPLKGQTTATVVISHQESPTAAVATLSLKKKTPFDPQESQTTTAATLSQKKKTRLLVLSPLAPGEDETFANKSAVVAHGSASSTLLVDSRNVGLKDEKKDNSNPDNTTPISFHVDVGLMMHWKLY
jgi:hypothetical protein